MRTVSKIDSSEYTDLNRVIRWFISLRWIAGIGVSIVLIVSRFVLGYPLEYRILMLLTGILVVLNGAFMVYFTVLRGRNLARNEMSRFFNVQIASDYIILFLLVYFTGYLENPLVYYFVFHIMLTSFIFPGRVVIAYVSTLCSVFVAVSLLELSGVIPHYPLGPYAADPGLYRSMILFRTFAICSTIAIAAYLVHSIERRIEERGRKVELELDRYKSLDKAKSNFILQVTHEIRGPVAALKGYHEMMLKGITGDLPERTMTTIGKADRRTRNLLTIIDEMIDFAYMKSEEDVRYDRMMLDARETIAYNIDLFSTRAREKDQKIVSACPRDLAFYANRDLMNIILGNLLSNAVKYSGEGTTITVNASDDADNVHLLVKDEGMGIEPEELDKIFEEFYRSRKAREIERDGTGLGLSIVQRAVDSLGGRISVYSEVGAGTSFHIYLPKGAAT